MFNIKKLIYGTTKWSNGNIWSEYSCLPSPSFNFHGVESRYKYAGGRRETITWNDGNLHGVKIYFVYSWEEDRNDDEQLPF